VKDWKEKGKTTGHHRQLLPGATKSANETLNLLWGRGYVEVFSTTWYPFQHKNDFTTMRRIDRWCLTEEGSMVLTQHMGPKYKSRWHPILKREQVAQYDQIDGDLHEILSINALAYCSGVLRFSGCSITHVFTNSQLEGLVRSGSTLLRDTEPDGLILYVDPDGKKRPLFIEADRTLQDENVIGAKGRKYGDYFRNRFPADQSFPGFTEPRVAFVTEGKGVRARNMKEALFAAGGRKAYWVTTLEWLVKDPTGPVWLVPTIDGAMPLIPTAPLTTRS
jgi:hypothetical protein